MNYPSYLRPARSLPLLALTLSLGTVTAAVPPADKILPADTLAAIVVPDFAKLNAASQKSPQVQMWNDAAMKPFRDKLMNKFDSEIVKPLEKDLGIKFADYTVLAQGVLAMGIIQEGWDAKSDKQPALVMVLDARDKGDQLKKNLADFRKKWVDSGRKLRVEKIRDVEFAVIALSSNDVPKSLKALLPSQPEVEELGKEKTKAKATKDEIYIGQFETALVVGTTPAVTEKVMIRLSGGATPALADDSNYEANRAAYLREASFYAWLNLRRIMDVVMKLEAPKPNPDAPSPFPAMDPPKILKALGLAGLTSAVISYQDAPEGGLLNLFLGAPEAGRQGLTKLLAMEKKESNPPPFVPADAITFQRIRFDLQKGIATLEKAVKDISPEFFGMWEYMLKNGGEAMKQSQPNFDIRKDLFGNFGDDIITFSKAPRDATLAALTTPPTLTLLGSPAPEKLASALRGILVLTSPDAMTPKEREFLGRKIYTITAPSMPMTASPGTPGSLHYCATGSYLAMSTDAAMLEEYLRSTDATGKPLRDTAGLADAAQKVGGFGTGWFVYEQQAEAMKQAFALMKKAGSDSGGGSGLDLLTGGLPIAGPDASVKDWMDFALLPDFDKVAKYFHFTVTAGAATQDGLSIKVFAPVPPGLKK